MHYVIALPSRRGIKVPGTDHLLQQNRYVTGEVIKLQREFPNSMFSVDPAAQTPLIKRKRPEFLSSSTKYVT